jgi:hypothetical protein
MFHFYFICRDKSYIGAERFFNPVMIINDIVTVRMKVLYQFKLQSYSFFLRHI